MCRGTFRQSRTCSSNSAWPASCSCSLGCASGPAWVAPRARVADWFPVRWSAWPMPCACLRAMDRSLAPSRDGSIAPSRDGSIPCAVAQWSPSPRRAPPWVSARAGPRLKQPAAARGRGPRANPPRATQTRGGALPYAQLAVKATDPGAPAPVGMVLYRRRQGRATGRGTGEKNRLLKEVAIARPILAQTLYGRRSTHRASPGRSLERKVEKHMTYPLL